MSTFCSQTLGSCAIAIAAALWLCGDANAQAAKRATTIARPAQSAAPGQEPAYAAAFDTWRAANDPQTAILVVRRGGKTVFAQAHNTDANGPSLIGSMSKAITAVCAATLIRDGKLSVTTPMREALADFFRSQGRPLDPRRRRGVARCREKCSKIGDQRAEGRHSCQLVVLAREMSAGARP